MISNRTERIQRSSSEGDPCVVSRTGPRMELLVRLRVYGSIA